MNSGGATPDALEQISLDVVKLRKELTDATSFLPSYDQRQCELRLNEIEQSLQNLRLSSSPKPKFAFKRKANKQTISTKLDHSTDVNALDRSLPTSSDLTLSGSFALSAHAHEYLDLWSFPNVQPSAMSDLTISDLDHCIVDLVSSEPPRGTPSYTTSFSITALHIRNVRNSILILPKIEGSALIHDLTRCIIAVGCHQFRMHTSAYVDVYLSVLSNPIIEHCTAIRFVAYPSHLLQIEPKISMPTSRHLSVQDFSHIRPTPSPNWSVLPENESIQDTAWPHRTNRRDVDLDASLLELLPVV
ncbi:hypothetical protein AcW1_002743 [Taiwanofungus camphoratus]|nr:hypothetical protein AcV7_002259 [Antrodia cinnamomea]KAI0942995.1 hypothetical protein AcV7_002259 [Antrodia cinnamomea]KAI0943624.1 hypothetical protein AcW1_002743 [Antrodia cinnamomea]KAI0943625.1 hypothetical protein AcW1_002743 [Antrodia cinnamomea]